MNALTNLAFFVAALGAYCFAKRRGALSGTIIVLLVILAAIGTGSTLFHTLAVHWAMLADTLPILLFQITFLGVYARSVMALSPVKTTAFLGGFLACIYITGLLPADWLNGSLGYAPALIFLGGLGLYHRINRKNEPASLLIAAGLFTASLGFRSLDMALCPIIPFGVHFIWHILNATVLYTCLRGLIANIQNAHTKA